MILVHQHCSHRYKVGKRRLTFCALHHLIFSVSIIITVRFFDEKTQVFILRCKRDAYRSAWAAMTLISCIAGQKASISVLHVSGSVYIHHHAAEGPLHDAGLFFLPNTNSGSVRTCRRDAFSLLVNLAGIQDLQNDEEAQAYANQLETTIQGV